MKKPGNKNNDWKYELSALTGFSLSGVFFIISSLKNGDSLSLIGSVVWVVACLFWMLPYRKHFSKESCDHTTLQTHPLERGSPPKPHVSRMTIRTVRPDDLNACLAVEQACFPPDEAADAEGIRTRIERFPQGFLVAEWDGMIVGQVNSGATHKEDITDEAFKKLVGHNDDGKNVVVFSLSVLPEYQGRGIAASLMREFIAAAAKQSRQAILLLCKHDLVSFYERLGFHNRGLSSSTHGGARWHEMALPVRSGSTTSDARNT